MDSDLQDVLKRQTFERILDILQQLGLHRLSPKFFVIYAHDSDAPHPEPQKDVEVPTLEEATSLDNLDGVEDIGGVEDVDNVDAKKESTPVRQHVGTHQSIKAHQSVVKDYITWFKKAGFDIYSDKSPHGYKPDTTVAHEGASLDIVRNQVCLLPHAWNDRNVDYVLVFYSELLAEYMKDERILKVQGKTYSEAIFNVCNKYMLEEKPPWDRICKEVFAIQAQYSVEMGDKFHHALTELALLGFTNKQRDVKYTIPIILFGDESWAPERKWKSEYVNLPASQIHIPVQHEEEYGKFFKIMLQFEGIQSRRPLIEALQECFARCTSRLATDITRDEYLTQVEVSIRRTIYILNNKEYWTIDGSINADTPFITDHFRALLNFHSQVEHSSLRRVSGEMLPENVNDIDLAVVRVDPAKEPEQIVTIHQLFDNITVRGKMIQPKRVLVQGKPGVGKTTLCKRIMYEYCWHESLRQRFELVVRIPVRELRYSRDLADLLFQEYFQVAQRGPELANAIRDHILGEKVKCLVILDGLDEAQGFSGESRDILQKLKTLPNIIITSRTYSVGSLSVDLELEAQGLSKSNVDSYLENASIVKVSTAMDIRIFIHANPLVADMVRTPILLDILCYCWDEYQRQQGPHIASGNGADDQSPTTTALYQAVVRTIFKKDIPFLGKRDHGELVDRDTIEAIQDTSRLERVVHFEMKLLEEIAIDMLETGRLDFTSANIKEIIQRLETKGLQLPLSLEKNLRKLSLIRSNTTGTYKRYSFVHLTFQEFFAARYISRNRDYLEASLRKHKYNRQYEIIWRFVPGLLSDPTDMNYFFDFLDQEPRDIVGKQHIHLIMHGFNECQHRLEPSRRDAIGQRLKEWFQLEMKINISGQMAIIANMAFPEDIIFDTYSKRLDRTNITYLIDAIRYRPSLSKKFVCELFRLSSDVYHPLLLVQLTLSPDTISFLMTEIRIGGKNKTDAQDTLASQPFLDDETLKELRRWLEVTRLRNVAIPILRFQSKLPREIIDYAMDRFIAGPKVNHSGDILASCRNVYSEAIDKMIKWFRTAANEVLSSLRVPNSCESQTPSHNHLSGILDNRNYISRILNNQDLQPEQVTELGTILQSIIRGIQGLNFQDRTTDVVRLMKNAHVRRRRRSRVGILIKTIVDVFYKHHNISTDILELFVQLLPTTEYNISEAVADAIQEQTYLHEDIIQALRDMFRIHPWQTTPALKGRITNFDGEFKSINEKINSETSKLTDYKVNCATQFLDGQLDLPDDTMIALSRYLNENTWWEIGGIVAQQRQLSDQVIQAFQSSKKLNNVPSKYVYGRPEFVGFMMSMMETRENQKAKDLLETQHNLDSKTLCRLVDLLDAKGGYKSQAAIDVLCVHTELSTKILSTLHNKLNNKSDVSYLWKFRSIDQFVTNLETICSGESTIMENILRAILRHRRVESISPAYIDGRTIWFYLPDGTLDSLQLKDERGFRKKYRVAQRELGIPEWACIQLPS